MASWSWVVFFLLSVPLQKFWDTWHQIISGCVWKTFVFHECLWSPGAPATSQLWPVINGCPVRVSFWSTTKTTSRNSPVNSQLQVLMTTSTTLGCIFMTPLICKLVLGAVVPVDAGGIVVSTFQVVLAPIFLGVGFNTLAPGFCKAPGLVT